jgi:hypothetical protein
MASRTTLREPRATRAPGRLVGNRLVLLGVLLYLAEWVAIIGAGGMEVWFPAGTDPDKVLDGYMGNGDVFSWAAGFFGIVLMGRVLYAVALRHGLSQSGHDDPLASFGVLASVVGVVLELVTCAFVAGIAVVADHGGSAPMVTTMDTVATAILGLVWGALGLAVLAMTAAMIRTRLFPRVLCGLGVLSGLSLVVAGLAFNAPSHADVQSALTAVVPLMWVWMLWTGVLLWRRTP